MIRTPHRSVTRFFIPMIDVLTLLFCMFLLMPIIRENESLSQEATDNSTADELKKEIAARQTELQALQRDQQRVRVVLADLAEKKRGLLRQSVFIRLLYVSPKDGTLHFFDPADLKRPPFKIDSPAAAAELIARHKKDADDRELLYIFQEPRNDNGEVAPFPTWRQEKEYQNWFSAVNYDGCVKPPPSLGDK